MKDKTHLMNISGQIEASLGHGAIKGEAKGSLDESLTESDAETTVSKSCQRVDGGVQCSI